MTLYTQACALCEKIGSEQPGLMDDADWQGYGRSFDMMYALSLNGETKSFRVTDKALLDYLDVYKRQLLHRAVRRCGHAVVPRDGVHRDAERSGARGRRAGHPVRGLSLIHI